MSISELEIKQEAVSDEEATTSIKTVKNEPIDEEFLPFSWGRSMDSSQDEDSQTSYEDEELNDEELSDEELMIPMVELKSPPDTSSNIEKSNDFYLLSNQWFGRKVCEENMIRVCPMCGVEFGNVWGWRQHLGNVHELLKRDSLNLEYVNTNLAICKECGQSIKSSQFMSFLVHAITHMPHKNYFKCKLCDWSTSFNYALKSHLQKQHVDIMTEAKKNADCKQCPYCQQKFITLNKMHHHMRYVHRNQIDDKTIFVCPYCDTEFSKNYVFRKHLKTKHPTNSVEEHNFEKVRELESGIRIYQCKICATTMRDSKNLLNKVQAHALVHKNKHCYKCKYCEKMFLGLILMRNHCCAKLREAMLLTPVSKEYLPEVTPAIGKKKLGDKRFKKLLMSNLRYVCPTCGHEFPTLQKCARHQKALLHNLEESTFLNLSTNQRKTPYKPFKCKVCKQYFNTKDRWLEHKCTVTENNLQTSKLLLSSLISYICAACNEEFVSIQTWEQHLDEIHKFNDLTALRMQREKGSVLKCLDCNQQLHDTASTRRAHRLLHLPLFKQFKCTQCQQTLSTEDDAYSHVMQCNDYETLFEELEEMDVEENSSMNRNATAESVDDLYKRGVNNADVEKYIKIICSLCNDMEFTTNNMLMSHLRVVHNSCRDYYTKHKNGSVTCNCCKRDFSELKSTNIIKHQLIHIRWCFLCKHCDNKFNTFTRITNHVVNTHMPTIVENATEDKSANVDPLYVTPNEVYRTSRLRMCVRREQASVFNKYNEYFLFACPECNEPFDTQELWHLHINSSHNFLDANHINIDITADGSRQCTECNLQITGGRLHEQRHKFTHMPYKAFICRLCQHRSNTIGVMIQHMRRRHFTSGAYKCPLCTEVLKMNVELHEHVNKEHFIAELPETTCRICLFTASKKSALIVHMEVHNPNRVVYTCDDCNRTYCTPKDLSRHKIKSHSNVLQSASETCENPSTSSTETNCDAGVEETEPNPISMIKVEEPDYEEFIDESK